MKLTAEQKQLLHECVDLAWEVANNTNYLIDMSFSEEELRIDIGSETEITEGEGLAFLILYDGNELLADDLRAAKDYLTKIETI